MLPGDDETGISMGTQLGNNNLILTIKYIPWIWKRSDHPQLNSVYQLLISFPASRFFLSSSRSFHAAIHHVNHMPKNPSLSMVFCSQVWEYWKRFDALYPDGWCRKYRGNFTYITI